MSNVVDRYRVVGNPIAQSKSPVIHRLFAEQTGQAISYDKALIEEGHFAKDARAFFSDGGKGMNVTAPFKHDALIFADSLSKRAELAGAVNTLAITTEGKVYGDNTDGQGLVWDITERLVWPIENQRVLILGAGGAAKGVLYMLLSCSPSKLVIANRTASRAQNIAEKFNDFGNIRGCGFSDVTASQQFDLIINATSASLNGDLPDINPAVFKGTKGVYDMVYGEKPTPFLEWAADSGAKACADGLGMLVGQAAESFKLWRHCEPNLQETYTLLRGTKT